MGKHRDRKEKRGRPPKPKPKLVHFTFPEVPELWAECLRAAAKASGAPSNAEFLRWMLENCYPVQREATKRGIVLPQLCKAKRWQRAFKRTLPKPEERKPPSKAHIEWDATKPPDWDEYGV